MFCKTEMWSVGLIFQPHMVDIWLLKTELAEREATGGLLYTFLLRLNKDTNKMNS